MQVEDREGAALGPYDVAQASEPGDRPRQSGLVEHVLTAVRDERVVVNDDNGADVIHGASSAGSRPIIARRAGDVVKV